MSLRPRVVNFDETWAKIRETLESVVTLKKIPRSVWNDRFSDVYALCVAFPEPLGEKLYAEVKDFLENHGQSLYEAVSGPDVDILRLYHNHWSQFSKGSFYMNLLFGYLNTHLKKQKQDYGDMSPYSTSFSPDAMEEVMDIGALALDIWKRKMIEPLKETLVEHVLIEVKRDREGEDTHQNIVHDTVLSFVEVQQYQSKGALSLYEEVFEKSLLKETKEYYRRESAELHADNTCQAFISKVDIRIQDEDLRTRKFFHPVSYSRVIRECEARMVEDYIPYLQIECRQMVQEENTQYLSKLFTLLKHIPRGLQAMVTELEEHITKTGLQAIKSVKVENGPQQYVDELLGIHRKFSHLIKDTFRDDPAFISALDKACATIVNYRHDPKRSSKSPELLAKYCDSILKKSTKNLSDAELDEKLGDIIIIFKYIDDKDIFQKFYSKMLAKRLIHTLSVSMDAEEGMISRLKHACGYEYTNKLHRMFTDISISSDLNSSFNDFLSNTNASLGVSFSLFVLQRILIFSEILEQTQLVEKELVRTLQSLADVRLILLSEDADPTQCTYSLNMDFSSKRTKLKVTAAVQRETPQDTEQTLSAVDDDRKMYLQAAIVRIMKSRKVLKHNALIQEVISQSSARFTPSIAMIKKCIEALIDKQYIERREGSKDEYTYMA
ncbi:cullin-2-like [Stylophora pistillata]|uniref:cullin-2-like n=1 Tax=Stylophora pistillata TaxID=50429 RepID=UPI000C03B3A8|nr:cullin-2-like [Stylophora pistillata]